MVQAGVNNLRRVLGDKPSAVANIALSSAMRFSLCSLRVAQRCSAPSPERRTGCGRAAATCQTMEGASARFDHDHGCMQLFVLLRSKPADGVVRHRAANMFVR